LKNYQDTETGQIWAFEDGKNPFKMNNCNIPTTLSETIIPIPSDSHVWHNGGWIEDSEKPAGYEPPISSVPAYNPAWTTFLFQLGTCILSSDEEQLKITLEQINTNSYNGEKLSEIVMNLVIKDYDMPAVISYDGAIAIPRDKTHSSQASAVKTLNKILGAIFLGGIDVKAIDYNTLECGTLAEGGKSVFSYFPSAYTRLRHNWASLSERIVLNHPKIIRIVEFQAAYSVGNQLLDSIQNFSPVFLLQGYSALQNRNLSDALSNLWIVVEQLTSHIWENKFLVKNDIHPEKIQGRKKSLKDDKDTWSIAVKHELLYQTNFLSIDCYDALSQARKARNNLVHKGTVDNQIVIENLWIALFELFKTASDIQLNGLRNLTTYPDAADINKLIFCHKHHELSTTANLNFDEWPQNIE